jgi:NIPSNAP
MIAEMRIYTVNGGMMDTYLELFNKQIVPNHRKHGIQIIGAWVDRKQNEVIWIRVFDSREERKRKLDVYEKSKERDDVFPIAAYHMAKAEVKILEDAFRPSDQPVQAILENAVAQKARAVYDAIPKAEADAFKASTSAPR